MFYRWYKVSPTLDQDLLLLGKMLDGQHISNEQFTYLCWHNGGRKLEQTWLLIGKILDITDATCFQLNSFHITSTSYWEAGHYATCFQLTVILFMLVYIDMRLDQHRLLTGRILDRQLLSNQTSNEQVSYTLLMDKFSTLDQRRWFSGCTMNEFNSNVGPRSTV